jgi:ATP-dependent Clp protease adaptor protein ClpS
LCDIRGFEQVSTEHSEENILAEKVKAKRPSLYKVLLLNDDYTPMEFVVLVLKRFFSMTQDEATQVMLKVHREGLGVCGVFTRDVATTKVDLVAAFAQQNQHPLQCTMEEA